MTSGDVSYRAGVSRHSPQTKLDPATYSALTEYGTDLVTILEQDETVRFVSPSYERTLGYRPEQIIGTNGFSRVHPDDLDVVRSSFTDALEHEGAPVTVQFRYRHADGSWRVLESTGTSRLLDPVVRGFIVNSRDITAHVEAEEQVREREAQYRNIFNATRDGLLIIDDKGLIVEANEGAAQMHGYTREELVGLRAMTLLHPDYHPRLAQSIRELTPGGFVESQVVATRKDGTSFFAEVRGSGFGYHGDTHMLAVLRDVSERVKAYELLEQRVRERTGELSTMLQVSRNVASTLELQPLLGLILDQLKTIVEYEDAGLLQVDGDHLQAIGYRGPLPEAAALRLRFRIIREELSWDVIKGHETVVVDDVRSDSPLARKYQHAVGDQLTSTFGYIRSFMSIPMMLKDRVIGAMTLSHSQPNYFTEEHASIAFAMAQQAAIAIENARLYTQAQEVATLEERQRLARELHDSVTQGLFSMTLHARSVQLQLEREGIPRDSRIAQGIQQLNDLTQGALAEMRALIFELRPGALQEEGLTAALRKHAAALSAREEVRIEVHAPIDRIALNTQTEAQLYRVAQEALHNAVKHAHAACIIARIELLEHGNVRLEVSDNGVGFDPSNVPPGHLGLQTMADRCRLVGGEITTHSALGRGTTILILVPNAIKKAE
jgi:PAS domain S-box-containing protein